MSWLPDRTPPAPEVWLPPPPVWFTVAPPLQPAPAWPATATALPQTLIGALIGATSWLPESTPPRPEVWLPPAPRPARCPAAAPLQPETAQARAPTALPPPSTG